MCRESWYSAEPLRHTFEGFTAGKLQEKARGAQENLWPKFILWSAPLRATSSTFLCCTHHAIPNYMKVETSRDF